MTAPTATTGPRTTRRGLTWAVLATHRTAFRLWPAYVLLGVITLAVLAWLGKDINAAREACARPCTDNELFRDVTGYRGTVGLLEKSLVLMPVVVAAFAGAALTGREMENGTAALAWTQSVSPVRWLAAKLTLPALCLAGGMVLLTSAYRWLRAFNGGYLWSQWHLRETFLATGPTGLAYVLLALVVGALVGQLVRRTLAALAVSVAVTGLVQFLGLAFWTDLWPKVTRIGGGPGLDIPRDAQLIDTGGITATGERFGFDRCYEGPQGYDTSIRECLMQNDAQVYVVYHPIAHYWPLQLVETGIVLALTAVLTVAAFRLLRRRLP